MPLPYRLIALDLDGTSVVGGQQPTPAVRRAVAAAEANGVRVVLATGRPYASALRYAEAFGLTDPILCFQGSLVKEVGGERATLFAESVPRAPLLDLFAYAEARDLDLTLYSEHAIYLVGMRRPKPFYDLWFGGEIEAVPSLEEGLRRIDAAGLVPLKCLFIDEPEANDRLLPELRAEFAGRLDIVRSHDLFVEAVSPRASKGRSLAFVADYYGIPRSQVIAMGDSGNDLSMVEWAGLGVAVANASREILAAADWVAPSVEEDAVAALVDRFVLKPAAFERAVALLRAGELVAFPTDTVYGVGAVAWDAAAVAGLYTAKLRPGDKAIPILLADPADIEQVARDLPPAARRIAEAFWPGPLTLVVPKAARVPDEVTAGGDTVAVRIPDHDLARDLIRAVGAPLATTSANLSGQPSPVTAQDVAAQLSGRIPFILDGGPCPGGVASTVVDLTGPSPVVLRPGPITLEQILASL
jgi:L-threonylcarbamoyladenylate synthase